MKDLIIKSKELNEIYLPTDPLAKKKNGEVSTPFQLRRRMVNLLPEDFWTNKDNKVLEPCCGKFGFLIDIIERFMYGLRDFLIDIEERYKYILENCLYFCDIDYDNVHNCINIIDPDKKYKLNYFIGNTLKTDLNKIFNVDGFDLVIGNPPYNSSENIATGNTIYQDFIRHSFKYLKNESYLVFINPPGWRKPLLRNGKSRNDGMYELMCKDNQLLYLNINNEKEGHKYFKCGTRFDYYLIQKTPSNKNSIVIDEKNIEVNLNMREFDFIPNYNIERFIRC